MKTLTVTLPDGSTDSRKSDRPYTHAVIVVITEARRKLVLDAVQKTIDEAKAVIAVNEPLMNLPEQITAYDAAKAQLAYLDENVTETCVNRNGGTYEFTSARWLSRSYRNSVGTEDERRRGRIDSEGNFYGDTAGAHKRAADAALLATARGKVEDARAKLECAVKNYEAQDQAATVGRAFVLGWSQSVENARKAERDARECFPGTEVYTTTEIQVHVPKARR